MSHRLTMVSAMLLAAPPAAAQTHYYNLDAGRPNRVEDAVPNERYSLDLHLAAIRVERMLGGSFRIRSEPKLSFGAFEGTEIEARAPFLSIVPPGGSGGKASHGFASVGVGVLHAFNLETRRVPAMAVSGELLLPMGSLAAPRTSYAVKVLATKTSTLGRAHINAAIGTYSVRGPASQGPTPDCPIRSDVPGAACSAFIPDLPCSISAPVGTNASIAGAAASRACGAGQLASSRALVTTGKSYGTRWVTGIGVDRPFPLRSMLVSADFVAERFIGFSPQTDLTAELGVRRQWTPQFTLDAGIARRFSGIRPGSSVTFGLTYSYAVRPFQPDSARGRRTPG